MESDIKHTKRTGADKYYEQKWEKYLNDTHDRMMRILVPQLREEDRILDVSGGTGLLAERLLNSGAPFQQYMLNDVDPRMLQSAQARLPDDARIEYSSYSACELPYDENRFTKVICLNALHEYERPSRAMRRMKDVLKPNGQLFLLDWNRSGWFRLIHHIIQWFEDGPQNAMSMNEVAGLLKDHRFRIEHSEQWRHRYWKLYLVMAGFQYWKDR